MTDISKDYVSLFKTAQGKRILEDLSFQFNETTVVQGDSIQTYGKSCAREVYLYIKYLSEESSDE